MRRLFIRKNLNLWRHFSLTTNPPQSTDALSAYYGEKFIIPSPSSQALNPISSPTPLHKGVMQGPQLSLEAILGTINTECDASVALYSLPPSQAALLGKPQHQLVLELVSRKERLTLAELLIAKFGNMTRIDREGMSKGKGSGGDSDWIVLDMGGASCWIHIFEPSARQHYDLDQHLQQMATISTDNVQNDVEATVHTG